MVSSTAYVTFFCFATCLFIGCYGDANEKKLLKYLFDPNRADAHNIMERPVKNKNNPVVVKIGFNLIEIINVNERKQNMKLNMWIQMFWNDYHFSWNPIDYDGLSTINIPSEKLWKPDIFLYNSANGKYEVTYPAQLISEFTTSMIWVPPVNLKSNCLMDLSWFPFDRQLCTMKFGSWTYKKSLVDIEFKCSNNENCTNKGFVYLNEFKTNNDFYITDNYILLQEMKYQNDSYPYMSVNIGIQRKYKYYIYTLIIPAILLSILALLIFTMPPDSKERITLGVVVLLIVTILLLFVSSKHPLSLNSIPMISKYFLFIMILCFSSIICSIFVLNCHHQSTDEETIASWIKDFIKNWLAMIVFMKFEAILSDEKSSKKGKEHSTSDLVKDEWKFAARVIDKCCVIIFSVATIITSMILITGTLAGNKVLA